MNQPISRPQTYEQWLSELKFQNEFDNIIKIAAHLSAIAKDKNRARLDIALVLMDKYEIDMRRASNSMVAKVIESDYSKITQVLFKCSISGLIKFVKKNEPNIEKHKGLREVGIRKDRNDGESRPLGFLQGHDSVDRSGEARPPLGFVRKPKPIIDEEGRSNPSLGFLGND